MLSLPRTLGKELEKEGAAWMAGKLYFPMLSELVKPKIPRTWFAVTAFSILTMLWYMCLVKDEEKEGKNTKMSKNEQEKSEIGWNQGKKKIQCSYPT